MEGEGETEMEGEREKLLVHIAHMCPTKRIYHLWDTCKHTTLHISDMVLVFGLYPQTPAQLHMYYTLYRGGGGGGGGGVCTNPLPPKLDHNPSHSRSWNNSICT